jgi:hypothetical protein
MAASTHTKIRDSRNLESLSTFFGDQLTARRNDQVSMHWGAGEVIDPEMITVTSQWDGTNIAGGPFEADEFVWGDTSGALGKITTALAGNGVVTIEQISITAFQTGEAITGVDSEATIDIAIGLHGSAIISSNRLQLSSGTDTDTEIKAVTARTGEYVAGHANISMFTCAWPDGGLAATNAWVGRIDASDGYAIGFNGTDFRFLTRKDGADTYSAFNLDALDGDGPSGFTIDTTKLNLFRLEEGYLGVAGCMASLLSDTGQWIPFHFETNINASAELVINHPDLPLHAQITKTAAAATNITMLFGCWQTGNTAENANPGYSWSVAQRGNGNAIPVYFKAKASAVVAARVDIWPEAPGTATIALPAPAGVVMSYESSSSSDVLGGIGAQILYIKYLDPTGNLQDKVLPMDGATSTSTGLTIRRMQHATVLKAGADGEPDGTIIFTSAAGAATHFAIGAGENVDLTGIYTVPLGKRALITGGKVSIVTGSSNTEGKLSLVATQPLDGPNSRSKDGLFYNVLDVFCSAVVNDSFVLDPPIQLDELVDLKARGIRLGGPGTYTMSVFLDIVEVKH